MTKEELRKIRRAKDVTQEKLASISGISLATINRAERLVRLDFKQCNFYLKH